MSKRQTVLSREQINQLSDANAELLEKLILELQIFGKKPRINYRQFWQKSEEIHTLFKKITPLKKADRRKLWVFFEEVRKRIKERQAFEKEIEKLVPEKISTEIMLLIGEIREVISKERVEPFEIENLLFSLEQLKSVKKGDILSLPDTPERAFVVFRLKGKLKLDENLKKLMQKTIEETEKWLKLMSQNRFEEIICNIEQLKREKLQVPLPQIKKVLRTITNEIMEPYLVREQKEKLQREVKKLYEEIAELTKSKKPEEEQIKMEKEEDKVKEGLKLEKEKNSIMKEIGILLKELEQTVLK